ncbi:pyridoxamine 5'-phosphate oxidase family protein [Ilumatobacter nonamiensis]|uniref:pyridoxamine 5'-phosphate oxidase family protein n=1 Tax=Ilumatobacter nonamiensis TaxID=467093 RepID=UPI0003469D0B|nr:pyridoxamine 5'-phosphate oxidase family protein [Ilumatobacter nonamiensis]
MSNEYAPEILSDTECWRLLDETTVGRLAVDVAGRPDIYPVNYVVDDGTIVFRTGAGTKFAAAALMHHVAFEIDGYLPTERVAWSVVVKGWADQVERMEEVFDAEDLPLFPWAADPKPNFVRITPHEVTGRRFHILDTIRADSSIGWKPVDAKPGAVVPEPGAEYHPGASKIRPS